MKIQNNFKQTEMGLIPKDWIIDTLENHLIIKGRIGWKGLKISEYTDKGPFIVGGLQIKENRVAWEECDHVTEERYEESPEIMLRESDILMTKDGTIGKLAYIDNLPDKATVASHIHVIRNKSNKVLPLFLFYFFKSPRFQNLVESKISGSVVPALTQKDINNTIFPLPLLTEQHTISKILSDFDSKIYLNRNMNKTLEEIGATLFKRWFSDFEFPNDGGDSYKTSEGKMVYNEELGKEIPEGWDVKPFSEVIAVNPKRELIKGKLSTKIGMTNLDPWNSWIENWSSEEFKSGPRFKNGDTLFARITPSLENGKTAFVSILQDNEIGFGSTEFIVLGTKVISSESYIFHLSRTDEIRNIAINSMTGTSGRQRVPNSLFDHLLIVLPPSKLIEKFEQIIAPTFRKISNNTKEIRTMSQLRDYILPKLMSGKIRVPLEVRK